MARQPARSRSPRSPRSPQSAVPQKQAASTVITGSGQFTGRLLVLLRDDGINEGLAALKSAAGLSDVCRAADFEGSSVDIAQAGKAEVLLLDHLKIAVVTADTRQTGSLMSAMDDGGAIVSVEPERIMYAQADGATTGGLQGMPLQYLRGYPGCRQSSLRGAEFRHQPDAVFEGARSRLCRHRSLRLGAAGNQG